MGLPLSPPHLKVGIRGPLEARGPLRIRRTTSIGRQRVGHRSSWMLHRPHDTLTLRLLKGKHPPRPDDRRPTTALSSAPLSVSAEDVRRAIRRFSPGSAGGLDGLRPQHLSDMTDSHVSGTLVESLTDFSNLVLAGGVPE